ncbi:MAG: SRPBCC family protein [Myxococcota bacterium]
MTTWLNRRRAQEKHVATVFKRLSIDAPIDAVWEKIADLEGVHNLMSFLKDAKVEGDRRVCTIHDGAQLTELILGVDPKNRRIAYSITDSPFGFEFHAASWQLRGDKDGTELEWFTDVKPDAAAETVSQAIDGEAAHIVSALAGQK